MTLYHNITDVMLYASKIIKRMNNECRKTRVSTSSQNLDNQIEQLKTADCEKIFSEKRSGKNEANRKEFNIMMDFVREGDILFITKLDRLDSRRVKPLPEVS